MPGANCAFPQCGASRTAKYSGLGIFQVSTRSSERYVLWRKAVFDVLTKYREEDSNFKQLMASGNVWTCERHYKLEDIEFTNTGRKVLRFGAIPTENLPEKSHPSKPIKERKHTSVVQDRVVEQAKTDLYQSLEEVVKRAAKLKIPAWQQESVSNQLRLKLFEEECMIPKFELVIGNNLTYTLFIYGWLLPQSHPIYTESDQNLKNITVSELIRKIEQHKICGGIAKPSSELQVHAIPYKVSLQEKFNIPVNTVIYNRPKDCFILNESSDQCKICSTVERKLTKVLDKKTTKLCIPAKAKAPVSITHPSRLKLTLQQHRLKCSQLQKQIDEMRLSIESSSLSIDSELDQDVKLIISRFNQDVVEEYFSRQRSLGRRSDNPDMRMLGYNDNTIRIQRSIVPVKGNTRGGHIQKRQVSWSIVDETKLAKRKRKSS
eukprot:gene15307-6524_t